MATPPGLLLKVSVPILYPASSTVPRLAVEEALNKRESPGRGGVLPGLQLAAVPQEVLALPSQVLVEIPRSRTLMALSWAEALEPPAGVNVIAWVAVLSAVNVPTAYCPTPPADWKVLKANATELPPVLLNVSVRVQTPLLFRLSFTHTWTA